MLSHTLRRLRLHAALPAAALLLAAATAYAKIDLVTLPARDTTQLTIYNSKDLTLARESRTLAFTPGNNQIQFSWANTLIDPTSLQIELPPNSGLTVTDAVYPPNTQQLIVWNIEAEEATSAAIEISYFTSGLSWSADYIARANADETALQLQQFTTVRNNSGEDFDNAQTRVVVGEVNLVEAIAELARRGIMVREEEVMRDAMKAGSAQLYFRNFDLGAGAAGLPMAAVAEAKEIIKKAVSEYYLFAVAGTEDIINGWGKELPNPLVEDIKFNLSYEIDTRKFGDQVVKFYKFKNDKTHNLGAEPLPEGSWYIYSNDGRDGLRFEGNTSHKYIPTGEDVELNLGADGLVLYEKRLVETKRTNFDSNTSGDIVGWDEIRTHELEITNTRARAIPIKLTEYMEGDWEFQQVKPDVTERLGTDTVRWELDAAPNAKTTIRYTIVIRNGSRARR